MHAGEMGGDWFIGSKENCMWEGGAGSLRAQQGGPAQPGSRTGRAWMSCPRWCFRGISQTDWTKAPASQQIPVLKPQRVFYKFNVCLTNMMYIVKEISSIKAIPQISLNHQILLPRGSHWPGVLRFNSIFLNNVFKHLFLFSETCPIGLCDGGEGSSSLLYRATSPPHNFPV